MVTVKNAVFYERFIQYFVTVFERPCWNSKQCLFGLLADRLGKDVYVKMIAIKYQFIETFRHHYEVDGLVLIEFISWFLGL